MKLSIVAYVLAMLVGQGVTLEAAALNPLIRDRWPLILLLWAIGFIGTAALFAEIGK